MRRLLQSVIALSMLGLLILTPLSVSAAGVWNPFGGADCTGSSMGSAACEDFNSTRGDVAGSDGLIMKIVNFVSLIAGIAAVVIIILAGLRMVQSGGNAEDTAGARRALIYAAVGLIVIALSRVILSVVFELT